jgi:hypothetical protein
MHNNIDSDYSLVESHAHEKRRAHVCHELQMRNPRVSYPLVLKLVFKPILSNGDVRSL